MSTATLITGKLVGEPTTRSTRTGGDVTFFKLKVASGNRLEFWSVATFSDTAREELAGLNEGDALSAVGELQVEIYEWKGETRINFKLTADRILALRPKPKARQAHKELPPRTGRAVAAASRAAPSRNDNQALEHRIRDNLMPQLNEALREGLSVSSAAPALGGAHDDDNIKF
jgi:single-stranded DNA-binding protein